MLSEPVPAAAPSVVAHGLTPVVYTLAGIDALAKAVADRGAHDQLAVHLKVDTGMHRVGCRTDEAVELAAQVVDRPELRLAGVCTHFAVADEPDNPYTAEQLARFDAVLDALRARGPADRHGARGNTAGAIDVAGRALRHRARRDRHLRHRARRRARRSRRAAARRCR